MNFNIWLCNLILFRLNLFTLNLNCTKLFEQKENKYCFIAYIWSWEEIFCC